MAMLRSHPFDALGLFGAIVYALPSLAYPFCFDQSIHWYLGVGILRGEVPYETAISTKPVAVFLTHALALLLFGGGQAAIRLMDLAFVLLAAALIASFFKRGTGEEARGGDGLFGAAALLMAGVHYTYFDYSDTAHPELWQGTTSLASLWVLVRAKDGKASRSRVAAAGALAALALLFKHMAVLSGVLGGAYACWLGFRQGGLRRCVGHGVVYSLTVALVLGLSIIPFWWVGALDTLWDVMVGHILFYGERAARRPLGVPPWLELDRGGIAVVCALCAWTVGAALQRFRPASRERGIAALTLSMLVLAFLGAGLQRRALYSSVFTYHFVVVGPFLALCLHLCLRRIAPVPLARVGLAALLVVCAFYSEPLWTHHPRFSYREHWALWLQFQRGAVSRKQMLDPYRGHNNLDRYARQERVGLTVRKLAREGDTMCVDGFATMVYAVADLRCTSRHLAPWALRDSRPAWREEYERVLREKPPTFYVTFSDKRQRINELTARGYRRHDVRDGGRPHFVIMQRVPPGESSEAAPGSELGNDLDRQERHAATALREPVSLNADKGEARPNSR